jgi:hypothetical protein
MKYRDLNLRTVLARLKQAGQDLLGVLGLSNWSSGWETKIFSRKRQGSFSPSYFQTGNNVNTERNSYLHTQYTYSKVQRFWTFFTKWSKWSFPWTRNRNFKTNLHLVFLFFVPFRVTLSNTKKLENIQYGHHKTH